MCKIFVSKIFFNPFYGLAGTTTEKVKEREERRKVRQQNKANRKLLRQNKEMVAKKTGMVFSLEVENLEKLSKKLSTTRATTTTTTTTTKTTTMSLNASPV